MIVTKKVYFTTGTRSSMTLQSGKRAPLPIGRIPRVAKLMAIAIRFDQLVRDGVVKGQAEIARLGHISRARMTQIINLSNLAPDIQVAILHLPRVERVTAPMIERELRPNAAVVDCREQRRMLADSISTNVS